MTILKAQVNWLKDQAMRYIDFDTQIQSDDGTM